MRKLLAGIWQVLAAFVKDTATLSRWPPRPPRRPSKAAIEKRLAEIETGRCPRCGARLFVSHGMQYLACENQYDPQRTLELAGSGNCSRMITSLEILRAECKRHGLEMPVL